MLSSLKTLPLSLAGDIKAAHTVYASTPEAQHSEITNFQDTRTGRTPLSGTQFSKLLGSSMLHSIPVPHSYHLQAYCFADAVACERGRLGIVRLLMSKGADVYAYDAETSTTPLMWAAGAGHAAIAAVSQSKHHTAVILLCCMPIC